MSADTADMLKSFVDFPPKKVGIKLRLLPYNFFFQGLFINHFTTRRYIDQIQHLKISNINEILFTTVGLYVQLSLQFKPGLYSYGESLAVLVIGCVLNCNLSHLLLSYTCYIAAHNTIIKLWFNNRCFTLYF
jgi:hypothetical protein